PKTIYFADLFREHSRLSKKLSIEELRALKRFIRDRVVFENQGLLFRLQFLKCAQDQSEKEYERSLSTLQKELGDEKIIAQEFQREFGNLTRVLRQREERYRRKNETLISDVKRNHESVVKLEKCNEVLQKEISEKEKVILSQEEKIAELEKQNRLHCKYDQLLKENAKLYQDILRLKSTIDSKNKEILILQKNLNGMNDDGQDVLTDDGRFWRCNGQRCLYKCNLEECRVELVHKCEENTFLNYKIQEGRRKLKEQARLIGALTSKPTVALPQIRPICHSSKKLDMETHKPNMLSTGKR
ncbi:uncharacterized protein LOC121368785, partial [Gigantopelta aegis]|uniref:uncharacterized protein LOC121368785 n=1 Tax=Gigantopelta aegis TaxID=1735272 RepID=UPI001B888572